eukprot:c16233_g1_i1 orf=154-477(+)
MQRLRKGRICCCFDGKYTANKISRMHAILQAFDKLSVARNLGNFPFCERRQRHAEKKNSRAQTHEACPDACDQKETMHLINKIPQVGQRAKTQSSLDRERKKEQKTC